MKGHADDRGAPITTVIADDDALARQGLKSLLETDEQFAIVAEVYDKDGLFSSLRSYRPLLVILESALLNRMDSDHVTRLMAVSPATRWVLMGTGTDPDLIIRALQSGIVGYIPKSVSPNQFVEACRQVAQGENPVLPNIAGALLLYVLQQRAVMQPRDDERSLTKRQYEVLSYMVEGYCNKEIAAAMHVSETTVKSHVTSILRKLGVTDRTQAVVKAIRERIVTPKRPEDRTG